MLLRTTVIVSSLSHFSPKNLCKTPSLTHLLSLSTSKPRLTLRPLSSLSTAAPLKSDPIPAIDPAYLSCSLPEKKPLKVAVLVSGGVDSSVALRLLHAAGHSCTAFYLKIWFQVATVLDVPSIRFSAFGYFLLFCLLRLYSSMATITVGSFVKHLKCLGRRLAMIRVILDIVEIERIEDYEN